MNIKVYKEYYDGKRGSIFEGPFTNDKIGDLSEFDSVTCVPTSDVLGYIEDVVEDSSFQSFKKDLEIADKAVVWYKDTLYPGERANVYQLVKSYS